MTTTVKEKAKSAIPWVAIVTALLGYWDARTDASRAQNDAGRASVQVSEADSKTDAAYATLVDAIEDLRIEVGNMREHAGASDARLSFIEKALLSQLARSSAGRRAMESLPEPTASPILKSPARKELPNTAKAAKHAYEQRAAD